jgi:hypothetical protein
MTTAAPFTLSSVTPNSKINGDTTYYIISFMPSVSYLTNSTMVVTIPSDITLTNPTCTLLTGTSSTSSCNVSSNLLKISLNSTTSLLNSILYQYQVQGFTNARIYTQTGNFSLTTYSSNNYLINTANLAGISNSQPNYIITLTSSVLSPTQSYLNSLQQIYFTLTTKNALIATDYIELTFPSGYNFTGSTSTSVCT